jgi:hypothetical protein
VSPCRPRVCAGPAGAASQRAAAEPAPRGHGTAVANPGQWRAHLLTRLAHRRARALADGRLAELHQELAGYPGGSGESVPANGVVLALRYRRGEQELALFSISAAVDTATDVTVEELAIETLYPPIRPRAGHSSQGCLPQWRDGRPFGVRHYRTGPRCEDRNDWPRSGPPLINPDQPSAQSPRPRRDSMPRCTHNQLICAPSLPRTWTATSGKNRRSIVYESTG